MDITIRATAVAAAGLMLATASASLAAPAAGDTYVYRVVNAYNKEPLGELRYRLDKVEKGALTWTVTPSAAAVGSPRTEVQAPDGNWLRRPLDSHGVPVEYEFATPCPAYAHPLDLKKAWSLKVKASAPGAASRTVRVDGKVVGKERLRLPAGEFDTIVIQRTVYPGDGNAKLMDTRITEREWYAPALGLPVRLERNSGWRDVTQCGRSSAGCDARGDWSLAELIEARPANR